MPDNSVLEQFSEFCFLKKQVGGPDVHMKAAIAGTENVEDDERLWRLAVYNNFCATPSAAVVWSRWGWEDVWGDGDDELENWIRVKWSGIPIRQNRRPARSVPKLTRSLKTLAEYLSHETIQDLSYEAAWDSLDEVYTWGRYVKIKFLETLRRTWPETHGHLEAPNIRAAGGWSPRRALSLIYPEYASVIANKSRNDKATLALVYSLADDVRAYVTDNRVPVSNYELEALLCNYRQTLSTRKAFYVGRTIDSEYEYHQKVTNYWDDPYLGTFDFFKTREDTFPRECLGEVQGWTGVRKDLSDVLTKYNYIWTDVDFCYTASKDDLEHPVLWEVMGV